MGTEGQDRQEPERKNLLKNFSEKVWKFEKGLYLCSPAFGERGFLWEFIDKTEGKQASTSKYRERRIRERQFSELITNSIEHSRTD